MEGRSSRSEVSRGCLTICAPPGHVGLSLQYLLRTQFAANTFWPLRKESAAVTPAQARGSRPASVSSPNSVADPL